MKTPMHICTVAAAKPLGDMLAHYVLAEYGDTPENLAKPLIFLPSRRSCRAMREAFLRASGGKPLLLPAIRPLGDMEEEDLFFSTFSHPELADGMAAIPPAIPAIRRRLMLAELIMQHGPKANVTLPVHQAIKLADALAELFDEIGRQQLDFSGLANIVPEDFNEHWQITYSFLEVIARTWPQALADVGMEEGVLRRNALLKLISRHWRAHPPQHPVIAAGSTGSIPVVAELLKTIASLPEGMVILPGLDLQISEDDWKHIRETHPQYGLAQLLNHCDVTRADVTVLDIADIKPASPPAREALLREALRPAESLDHWQSLTLDLEEATQGLNYLHTHTQHEEAQIIAMLLRETLETEGKTAVCITRDRTLARMVITQMQRFGIALNDSAGMPLSNVAPARLLLLIVQCVMNQCAPVSLLALLKHPLARAGLAAAEIRTLTRELEVTYLRGVLPASGSAALEKIAHTQKGTALGTLLGNFLQQLEPLRALLGTQHPVKLSALMQAHLQFAQWLCTDEEGQQLLWQGAEGNQLADFTATLIEHSADFTLEPALYGALLDSFLKRESFRPAYGLHPRLAILSPIEARLQHFDRVILAGLNEGNWPPVAEASPWLSRPMQRQFGLPRPEVRIGQSAHDFALLALNREVFITRSEKEQGSPSTPSRWLVRLHALMTKHRQQAWEDLPYRNFLHALNQPIALPAIPKAGFSPPVDARPDHFRVTEIETLMVDPYSIYAKKVLKLPVLDALEMAPGNREYGTFVHSVMERFVQSYPHALPENAEAILRDLAREVFAPLSAIPIVRHYWLPRFEQTIAGIVQAEAARRAQTRQLYGEIKGVLDIPLKQKTITLSTRIDSVEVYANEVAIVDYKTGSVKKPKKVLMGTACQLPLMALVLREGTFEMEIAEKGFALRDLLYWRLSGRKVEITSVTGKSPHTPAEELLQQAREGLVALLAAFDEPTQSYFASPVPGRSNSYNDYIHLIRKEEWDAA